MVSMAIFALMFFAYIDQLIDSFSIVSVEHILFFFGAQHKGFNFLCIYHYHFLRILSDH